MSIRTRLFPATTLTCKNAGLSISRQPRRSASRSHSTSAAARGRSDSVMDRRAFVITALLSAVGSPALRAQRAQPPVQLGFLRIVAPPKDYIDALEQGLRDRGYVPGRDVVIEYRFAEGREDQLDRLAKELVERKVAIIIVAGNQAARAARNATRTIPIVMAVVNDPVASGLVASLARPGGNITGTSLLSSTLAGKRLELLKQVLPHVSRVAVLLNKDNPAHAIAWKETIVAATTLRIDVQPFEVQGGVMPDLDEAFAISQERTEALSPGRGCAVRDRASPLDRSSGRADSAAGSLWAEEQCRRWRSHVLWAKHR